MPPFAYFTAKVVTSMTFSTIIVLALFALGIGLGGVRMPLAEFRKPVGNFGRGLASLFRARTRARILHRAELGSLHHQSYLFAHVVLQRAVGAD